MKQPPLPDPTFKARMKYTRAIRRDLDNIKADQRMLLGLNDMAMGKRKALEESKKVIPKPAVVKR